MSAGTLYVVSTPIGNMGDFSFRAVETLRSVALILAEDTRHSRALLDRYEITTPVRSYHEHNEARSAPALVEQLVEGTHMALISDAGTPLLSDPGQRLVNAAIAAGVSVVPIPGASALLAALVGSGLDAGKFTFLGFVPRKGRERESALDAAIASAHTTILYEAPTRLADTLADLAARDEARATVVARELTKHYEEFRRGTLAELRAYYEESPPRGEVVIVVAGAPPISQDADALRAEARSLSARGLTVRDVAAELTRQGAARNEAYRIARAVADEGSAE